MTTKTALVGLVLLLLVGTKAREAAAQVGSRDQVLVEYVIVRFREQAVQLSAGKTEGTLQNLTAEATRTHAYLQELRQPVMLEKYLPSFEAADTLRVSASGSVAKLHDWSRVFKIRFAEPMDFFKVKAKMEALPEVEYVAPPVRVISHAITPNDLHKEGHQWYLPKVQALDAWEITKGSSTIRIVIIDEGVAPHVDINGKLVGGEATYHVSPQTGRNHGLSVAGVAAAQTDNDLGLAGLGWNLMIVPKDYTNGTDAAFDMLDAVLYRSAKIVNCSFHTIIGRGGNTYESYDNPVVRQAVEDVQSAGALVVASAGNPPGAGSLDTVPYEIWPAQYPGVLAVSATNSSDIFPSGYNYGSHVDVSGPAVGIRTLNLNGTYVSVDGTSFSAPLAAATAGLIWTVNPALTAQDVAARIIAGVDDLGPTGYDLQYGHGRLNAYRAVKEALPLQYDNATLSTTTLTGGAHIAGNTTLASGPCSPSPQARSRSSKAR